jgi:signal peptidase I
MRPLLQSGQLLLAKKAHPESITRGKIVTFYYKQKLFIKRIIGCPRETLEYRDGSILVNNQKLLETYLLTSRIGSGRHIWDLNDDEWIILGDNSRDSLDSRKLGPINTDDIREVIIFRLWPLGRLR